MRGSCGGQSPGRGVLPGAPSRAGRPRGRASRQFASRQPRACCCGRGCWGSGAQWSARSSAPGGREWRDGRSAGVPGSRMRAGAGGAGRLGRGRLPAMLGAACRCRGGGGGCHGACGAPACAAAHLQLVLGQVQIRHQAQLLQQAQADCLKGSAGGSRCTRARGRVACLLPFQSLRTC